MMTNINTKVKNIIQITKRYKNSSEHNIANIFAFCVWSEKMPCQENLAEILTNINLFYATSEFSLDSQAGIDDSLFTNNLYIELLNNLKQTVDINAKFAMMCIILAKKIKKNCENSFDNYLTLFDEDKIFKTLLAYFSTNK